MSNQPMANALRQLAEAIHLFALALELDDHPDEDFLSTDELAVVLSLDPYTVRKRAREGKLKFAKVGNRYRFPRTEVARFAREGL